MGRDVDVVKAVFEAFARRDLDAVLELSDSDVELTAATADLAGRTDPYRGHEGIRRYFEDVAAVWEELRLTPGDYRELGGEILVTGRVHARSRGRIVDGSTGWIWRLRDGKVVYVHVYSSAAEAESAALGSG